MDNLYLSIFELQTSIGGLEDQIVLSKQVYDAVSLQDTSVPPFISTCLRLFQQCSNESLISQCPKLVCACLHVLESERGEEHCVWWCEVSSVYLSG